MTSDFFPGAVVAMKKMKTRIAEAFLAQYLRSASIVRSIKRCAIAEKTCSSSTTPRFARRRHRAEADESSRAGRIRLTAAYASIA
jgi:hypothetical protein